MFGRAESRDLKLAACNGGVGGGLGHSVPGARAPPSLFQFGNGAWHVQQSISAVRVAPALPDTAKPSAAAQLLAPPPARASSSSEAAARSPLPAARSESSRRRFFLSPLLLSPSHSPPPRSHVLPALCKCPWPPRASRCREVSGGSGSQGDSSGACRSQPLPPPAGREKRRHAALGCGCWREAVPA